jgi:hypothetical protein
MITTRKEPTQKTKIDNGDDNKERTQAKDRK